MITRIDRRDHRDSASQSGSYPPGVGWPEPSDARESDAPSPSKGAEWRLSDYPCVRARDSPAEVGPGRRAPRGGSEPRGRVGSVGPTVLLARSVGIEWLSFPKTNAV
jgi:hypothetical protein